MRLRLKCLMAVECHSYPWILCSGANDDDDHEMMNRKKTFVPNRATDKQDLKNITIIKRVHFNHTLPSIKTTESIYIYYWSALIKTRLSIDFMFTIHHSFIIFIFNSFHPSFFTLRHLLRHFRYLHQLSLVV